MARILVTGSTTGLGLAAAQALVHDGHSVIAHARNAQRAEDLGSLGAACAGIVIGNLASAWIHR